MYSHISPPPKKQNPLYQISASSHVQEAIRIGNNGPITSVLVPSRVACLVSSYQNLAADYIMSFKAVPIVYAAILTIFTQLPTLSTLISGGDKHAFGAVVNQGWGHI